MLVLVYILVLMARLSRFSIARGDIIKTFDALGKTYYTAGDLSEILNRYRTNWRLTKSMRVEEFAKELTSKTPFRKIMLPFPARTYLRYAYRDFSVMTLAAQLSAKSYLSHYTALSLHGLTEQIPKIITSLMNSLRKRLFPPSLLKKALIRLLPRSLALRVPSPSLTAWRSAF